MPIWTKFLILFVLGDFTTTFKRLKAFCTFSHNIKRQGHEKHLRLQNRTFGKQPQRTSLENWKIFQKYVYKKTTVKVFFVLTFATKVLKRLMYTSRITNKKSLTETVIFFDSPGVDVDSDEILQEQYNSLPKIDFISSFIKYHNIYRLVDKTSYIIKLLHNGIWCWFTWLTFETLKFKNGVIGWMDRLF